MSDDATKTPRRRKTGGSKAPAKKARATRAKKTTAHAGDAVAPVAKASPRAPARPEAPAAAAEAPATPAAKPARRDPAPQAPPSAPGASAADPLADFFFSAAEGGGTGALLAAAVAAAEPAKTVAEEAEEEAEYLSFWLAAELYAVPVSALREIVRPLPITEVPRTPPWILGVITLRGTVLPVFDLRLRLGLPVGEDDRNARILVLEGADGHAGILADRVDQVVRAGDDLELAPGALGGSDHIEGLLRRDGRMIIVLNLDGALRVGERRARETA